MRNDAEEMLGRAKAGDSAAFGWLVGEHQSMVFSITVYFFRNRAIAEEIAQDVFLDLYRNLAGIENTAHLLAWLRRNATNRCIDRSRRKSYRAEVPVGADLHPVSWDSSPDVLAYAQVQRELAALPAEQRVMIILRYGEGMMPGEIAEALELPVNTVKSRLHRALGALRSKLELKKVQLT